MTDSDYYYALDEIECQGLNEFESTVSGNSD